MVFSNSAAVNRINLLLTVGLIVAIAVLAAVDPGVAAGKPKLLAWALCFYAFYLAGSSFVTGRILGQLVFLSRSEYPGQFWFFFVIYTFAAILFGAYAFSI